MLYYIIMDTNNGVYRVDIKDISCGAFDCDAEGVRHKKILTSFSVVQSVRGSYDIRVGDSDFYSTGELGVFLAPADVTQEIVHHNGAGGTMEAQWVFIDAVINEAFCLDEYFSFPVLLSEKYGEEIYGILQQLRLSENYFKKMRAAYRLMEILAAEGQRRKNFDPVKAKIERFVKEHYAEDIGARHIAEHLFCSVPQVFRYTHKYYSFSPANYINSIRLQQAELQMRRGDKTITEIAYSVGFSDSAYFSKTFKKFYGESPVNYRKKYFS